jgi:hypothetical protein
MNNRRRNFLASIGAVLLSFFLLAATADFVQAQKRTGKNRKNEIITKKIGAPVYKLTREDQIFLEDLEKRAFRFFWEQSNSETGLTADRARADGSPYQRTEAHYNVASIAATGFALTSYCIAAERNWTPRREVKDRARITLAFFADRAFHKNGWFYHWMDAETGERRWNSEVSSIDTALLLGGVLTVRQCFAEDKEIVRLATRIYERVDFGWMLNGDPYLLSHGWKPETGFLPYRWDTSSEHLILYLLGIGSPTHPLSWRSWYAWRRDFISYGKYRFQASLPPLFIHQYSHAWVDFRRRRERFRRFKIDYFENSVTATAAQRQFFINLANEFPIYAENVWGLTASDSREGYKAWGAPPRPPDWDGTVVPCAAAGSLMFAPEITLPALKTLRAKFGDEIYGRYGFTDAFNPQTNWINRDVIGIDVGITLLSAENLRTGNVWRWFMLNSEPVTALSKAKLQ